jgi:hypothetical protein
MFSVLVTTMTLITLGFVMAWWLRPDVRDWMEAPKYRRALFSKMAVAPVPVSARDNRRRR